MNYVLFLKKVGRPTSKFLTLKEILTGKSLEVKRLWIIYLEKYSLTSFGQRRIDLEEQI
jgi:hypothetical protein